jgi:hypothetical protein
MDPRVVANDVLADDVATINDILVSVVVALLATTVRRESYASKSIITTYLAVHGRLWWIIANGLSLASVWRTALIKYDVSTLLVDSLANRRYFIVTTDTNYNHLIGG